MFKLVAILFAVVNGEPSEKPAGALRYDVHTFATEQACSQFIETDKGKIATEILGRMIDAQRGAMRFCRAAINHRCMVRGGRHVACVDV